MTKSKLISDKRVNTFTIYSRTPGPSLLIISGVHGGENSAINVCLDLLGFFSLHPPKSGKITFIPIVNIDGFTQMTRNNPADGKNINSAGETNPQTVSDLIANEIIGLSSQYDYFLDLHSASSARYIPHIYYHNLSDRRLAASFGLKFGIFHNSSKESGTTNYLTLTARSRQQGKTVAFAIESGGGHIINLDDVEKTSSSILNFCFTIGLKSTLTNQLINTPQKNIFSKAREDLTHVVKTPCPGIILFHKQLGSYCLKDEIICSILRSHPYKEIPIKSPCNGTLILTRSYVHADNSGVGKDTLFRIMKGRLT